MKESDINEIELKMKIKARDDVKVVLRSYNGNFLAFNTIIGGIVSQEVKMN